MSNSTKNIETQEENIKEFIAKYSDTKVKVSEIKNSIEIEAAELPCRYFIAEDFNGEFYYLVNEYDRDRDDFVEGKDADFLKQVDDFENGITTVITGNEPVAINISSYADVLNEANDENANGLNLK